MTMNEDCSQLLDCHMDSEGTHLRTTNFTCGTFTVCVANNRRGQCQCLPGYNETGDTKFGDDCVAREFLLWW